MLRAKKDNLFHTVATLLALALVVAAMPVLAAPGKVSQIKERPIVPAATYVEGEVLVKFKSSDKPFEVLKVPNVEQAVAAMSKNPNVEVVEPNYIATAFATVNDPYYAQYQWNFQSFDSVGGVGAEAAWDVNRGANTVVAVIDTGIATAVPDLAGTCFTSTGYDFVNNDNDATDDEGHGTHVAGTIAQTTNNGLGVAGLAHESCLMAVKVLDATGSGSYENVVAGIYHATDNGADVINLSLGGPASDILRSAVQYAYEKGVTVVAATGNDNAAVSYPAAYDEYVIAVGATRKNGVRAPYSNYGAQIDLVAPGGYFEYKRVRGKMVLSSNEGIYQQTLVPGTTDQFNYYFYSGTSMATPHVAAAAAMVLSNGNASTPDEVRTALQSTARDLGTAGFDQYYGHGIIDLPAALVWISGPVDAPPSVTIDAPADGIVLQDVVDVQISMTAGDDIELQSARLLIDGLEVASTTSAGTLVYDWAVPQVDGQFVLRAEATDSSVQLSVDEITVTIDNVDSAPTASISVPNSAEVNTEVTMSAVGSSDDRRIESYTWDFADNSESVVTITDGVAHTFTATGTYTVSVTVADKAGQTDIAYADIIVTDPAPAADIVLSAVEYKIRGRQQVDLTWSGAGSTDVDVYRDGRMITTTANGGAYTDAIGQLGGGSYVYKLCEAGTTICSDEVLVVF